jgi:bidirectional [NiFe] hydrogenase diaphorase subunit
VSDPDKAFAATDERWRVVDATMRRHGNEPEALIETLHVVQATYGYVEAASLRQVARVLGVPPSQAYGVATFYHLFSLRPPGRHTCVVCTGTACYIQGAAALLAGLERSLGVRAGETTADGAVGLATARCIGPCGVGPVGVFDGEVTGRLTPAAALARLRQWTGDDA